MSQLIDVPNPLTPVQIAEINAHFDAIEAILATAKLVITPAQSRSMVKVSVSRRGLIADVDLNLVGLYPQFMPASITVAEYRNDIAYKDQLSSLFANAKDQSNGIQILLKSSNNNLMTKTTRILDSNRAVAPYHPLILQKLDDLSNKYFNSKPGKKKTTGFKIIMSGIIVISNVIPQKPFTNKGGTVLSILNVGGNINDTILLNSFTGKKLPDGWNNIVVTNLSADSGGSFDVFISH